MEGLTCPQCGGVYATQHCLTLHFSRYCSTAINAESGPRSPSPPSPDLADNDSLVPPPDNSSPLSQDPSFFGGHDSVSIQDTANPFLNDSFSSEDSFTPSSEFPDESLLYLLYDYENNYNFARKGRGLSDGVFDPWFGHGRAPAPPWQQSLAPVRVLEHFGLLCNNQDASWDGPESLLDSSGHLVHFLQLFAVEFCGWEVSWLHNVCS